MGLVTEKQLSQMFVCGHVVGYKQYWPGGFMVLWFYIQEHPKAQPAVVLILKPLRRRGNGLKSRPTDWEKPQILFVAVFLGFNQYCPGEFMSRSTRRLNPQWFWF